MDRQDKTGLDRTEEPGKQAKQVKQAGQGRAQ